MRAAGSCTAVRTMIAATFQFKERWRLYITAPGRIATVCHVEHACVPLLHQYQTTLAPPHFHLMFEWLRSDGPKVWITHSSFHKGFVVFPMIEFCSASNPPCSVFITFRAV